MRKNVKTMDIDELLALVETMNERVHDLAELSKSVRADFGPWKNFSRNTWKAREAILMARDQALFYLMKRWKESLDTASFNKAVDELQDRERRLYWPTD